MWFPPRCREKPVLSGLGTGAVEWFGGLTIRSTYERFSVPLRTLTYNIKILL